MKWVVQRFDFVYYVIKFYFDDFVSRYGNFVIVLSFIKVDNFIYSYDFFNVYVRLNVYYNYDIL